MSRKRHHASLRNRPQVQRMKNAVSPSAQIKESIDPTYFSASPTTEDVWFSKNVNGSDEDFYWRRLSDTFYQKDLIPSTYLEIHNQCFEAYNANPLAFAIIDLTTSFVLGEGITVSASNKRVQQVIDNFWDNPENHMDERVYSLCTELSLYGEQFIHFFVNKYDGSVIIRQIDPSLIDMIETDPEDIEKPLRYHRRPIGQVMAASTGDPPPSMVMLKPGEETQGTWFKAGDEVLQIAINKVSNAKRGKSDLATLLPWLRRYKDWLTDRVRINKYKAAFLWDVKLTGADKKTIDRKKMEYAYPPEPGSVIIHNEAEQWTAVDPKIAGQDASEDGRSIKLMVAVGATLPEHYLSDGDNGNRATASEMSLPTLLKFKRRQRIMRYMLTQILDRVIAEAQKVGKIAKTANISYDITFPEMDTGEGATIAQGMNQLITALSAAKAQGWVSDETAMRIMYEFCSEDVDVHEEMAKIQAQHAARHPLQGNNPPVPPPTNGKSKQTDALNGKNGYGNELHPFVAYDGGYR